MVALILISGETSRNLSRDRMVSVVPLAEYYSARIMSREKFLTELHRGLSRPPTKRINLLTSDFFSAEVEMREERKEPYRSKIFSSCKYVEINA